MVFQGYLKKVIATRNPYESVEYLQYKHDREISSLELLAFDSIVKNHVEIGSLNISTINPIIPKNRLWIQNDCVVKLNDTVGIRHGRFFGYTSASKLVFLDSLVSVEKSTNKVKAAVLRLLCKEKQLAEVESEYDCLSLLDYLTLPGYFESYDQYVSLPELKEICHSNGNRLALKEINRLIERYEIYEPIGE